jgi:hypothetical protein
VTRSARALALPLALATAAAIPGCMLLPDLEGYADARVEVDPTVIRTIHYWDVEGEGEVTTLALDEIECLGTTPVGCRIGEAVRVTIRNTGTRMLYRHGCDFPLERFGLGVWHRTRHPPICTLVFETLTIAPGESDEIRVDVDRMPAGLYRVRPAVSDGMGSLPGAARTSAPFHLQPLPDFQPFVCPAMNEAERAAGLAREALDKARRGESGINRLNLDWENEFPGLGGIFLGNGFLNVWLKDMSQAGVVADSVQAAFGRRPRVRKGDFSYSELVGWRQALGSHLSRVPGGVRTHPDESLNRVRVDLANELDRADVECAVDGIGMPAGMADIAVR